ncbi:MAG: GTP pyrophosphokinase family protein [Eubacteriales bacterium]|jgi:ppGpp synthetase/RelA/SpoT-type nucleotidyltranferase
MESIYGEYLPEMQEVMKRLEGSIDTIRGKLKEKYGSDPVEHCLSRIKSEESMREKCHRKDLPETTESALDVLTDAIGLRVICAFVKDVYTIRDYLASLPFCEVVTEKDYIRHAKPNGYRSYHMILKVSGEKAGYSRDYFAEFQLRTISMDTWAALEHHLKYKKNPSGNTQLLVKELKRCADELAATDMSMQTLRNMIYQDELPE